MRENMWVLYLAGGGMLIFGLLLLVGVSDWWRNRRQQPVESPFDDDLGDW